MTSSDQNLLLRYAEHADPGAFEELVRRYAAMVFGTARRVTGDGALAEDVSQDCFLRLAQRARQISGSVGAWLHRAAVNRAIELRRSDQARQAREAQVASRQLASSAASGASDLITRVDEALASLPDSTRVLITEHYLCGRSQSDLAAQEGVNQSTIQRRIEKGIQDLRRRLQGEHDDSAAGVLPVVLIGLRDVAVPAELRQSILKIGLSGVGGAAHGKVAGAVLAAVAWKKLATAVVLLLGLGVLARGIWVATVPARSDAGGSGLIIALDEVPPAVRTAIQTQTRESDIREIERKIDLGRTVYDIDFRDGQRMFEIRVREDGTLVWRKPSS
jgi:RNA polymerase sigma factor (sigma-70 family)